MSLMLVDGASGIGRAAALRGVRPEGAIVILDRDSDGVKRVVRELTSRGGAAHAVIGDVRDASSRADAPGRSADPADVARVITWLLSDDAAWISGTDIPVDQAETAVASGMFRS